MLTEKTILKIRQIVRCFETGVVEGANYSAIALLPDGPNKRIQVTYGASQTTEYGSLKILLQQYIDNKGSFAAELLPYIKNMGNVAFPSLQSNRNFIEILKKAGKDPVMQATQDHFFTTHYFNPAKSWGEKHKFLFPLSYLVIYDSFVHSGGILSFLRLRFTEKIPSLGGNEQTWVEQYINARDSWLERNSDRILRNTDYRTDSFVYAMRENNWTLDKPFLVVSDPDKDEKQKPTVRQTIP